MEIFKSKKGKYIFWGYFFISLIIFILCAIFLNGYDKLMESYSHISTPKHTDAFLAANLFVLIPLTYIIMLAFIIMKFKMYKTHKNRYKSFKYYTESEQSEFLKTVFCENCKTYNNSIFKEEKMLQGMRWIYCECKNCQIKNKTRIT